MVSEEYRDMSSAAGLSMFTPALIMKYQRFSRGTTKIAKRLVRPSYRRQNCRRLDFYVDGDRSFDCLSTSSRQGVSDENDLQL